MTTTDTPLETSEADALPFDLSTAHGTAIQADKLIKWQIPESDPTFIYSLDPLQKHNTFHFQVIPGHRMDGRRVTPEEANCVARRLVACWQACEGINTSGLDAWLNPPPGQFGAPHGPWAAQLVELWDEHARLTQRNTDLIELLKRVTKDSEWSLMDGHLQDDISKAIGDGSPT